MASCSIKISGRRRFVTDGHEHRSSQIPTDDERQGRDNYRYDAGDRLSHYRVALPLGCQGAAFSFEILALLVEGRAFCVKLLMELAGVVLDIRFGLDELLGRFGDGLILASHLMVLFGLALEAFTGELDDSLIRVTAYDETGDRDRREQGPPRKAAQSHWHVGFLQRDRRRMRTRCKARRSRTSRARARSVMSRAIEHVANAVVMQKSLMKKRDVRAECGGREKTPGGRPRCGRRPGELQLESEIET